MNRLLARKGPAMLMRYALQGGQRLTRDQLIERMLELNKQTGWEISKSNIRGACNKRGYVPSDVVFDNKTYQMKFDSPKLLQYVDNAIAKGIPDNNSPSPDKFNYSHLADELLLAATKAIDSYDPKMAERYMLIVEENNKLRSSVKALTELVAQRNRTIDGLQRQLSQHKSVIETMKGKTNRVIDEEVKSRVDKFMREKPYGGNNEK